MSENIKLHFTKNRNKNYELILENGNLSDFIKKVKHLCVNNPEEYKGMRVHFEVLECNVETVWNEYLNSHEICTKAINRNKKNKFVLNCKNGTKIVLDSVGTKLNFKIYIDNNIFYKNMSFKELEAYIERCNEEVKINRETYIDKLKELGFVEEE